MKAKILKLAGVKDEASFYKKFPTEKAFMAKYGAEFKKLQYGGNEIPDGATSPFSEAGYMPLPRFNGQMFPNSAGTNTGNYNTNFPTINDNAFPGQNTGQNWANRNPLPEGMTPPINPDLGWSPEYEYTGNSGNKVLESLPMVGKVFQGLSALEAEKQQRRAATQMQRVSEVALEASGTRPEQRERRWVRPEDNVVDGNALFPVNGIGTNVLAKFGKDVVAKCGGRYKKAQNGAGFENFMLNGPGQIAPSLADYATGNNAGNSIGGGIGGALGSAFGGPAGQMAGQAVGSLVGGMLDRNPRRTRKAQEATMRNVNNMALNQAAPIVQAGYASYLENGGNVYNNGGPIDGELQLYEGSAESMANNPYLPGEGETIMFRGPSHAKGGMDINYAGNNIEVEGGEPAVKLPNEEGGENLTVFGDINIPNEYVSLLGDERAKGKKFKSYVADLTRKEAKQTKILDKSSSGLESLEVQTPFDKLTQNSYTSNILGADMRMKEIAQKKMSAATLQKAINETADQLGVEPNAMLKGKLKANKLKNKAQYGEDVWGTGPTTTTQQTTIIGKNSGFRNKPVGQDNLPYDTVEQAGDIWSDYDGKWKDKVNWAYADENRAEQILNLLENYQGEGAENVKKILNKQPDRQSKLKRSYELATDRKVGPYHRVMNSLIDATEPGINIASPDKLSVPPGELPNGDVDNQFGVIPYKKNPWVDGFNTILPFLRPSNQEPLDGNQLLGEMYAMSTNQLEPVQAQTYQPDLGVPYDISYQDQLNANQADYRSAQRMVGYNPAAQGALNSQKYQANSQVLGEQFRANQAMKDRVYGENRNILNDAKLKNLAIYDQQYGRQSQAISNTKATSQAVLNSISDKYMKNKLENRTLATYENMYNYRYDASGRAINMNPLFQPNIPQKYKPQGTPNYIPVTDKDGNIIEYRLDTPSMATPGINGNAKNGKSIKQALNGSIVKAYKTI